MMRAPWFWRDRSLASQAIVASLTPLSILYDAGQKARWRLTNPATPAGPVICIGNATLGGVGKTPFAMMLQKLLSDSGVEAAFLTRGYGGAMAGPVKVDIDHHGPSDVGDEALLLARRAPVWVSKNRVAGAAAAFANGAALLIMDDGYQNPTLKKSVSILLIDAEEDSGMARLFPAGPYREPLKRALERADLVVYVGATEDAALRAVAQRSGAFAAWLRPADPPPPRRVVAFSGIGAPQKFFRSLHNAGFDLAKAVSFPDHHPYNAKNLKALTALGATHKAPLITTEKDAVRLPGAVRENVLVFPVAMTVNDPQRLTDAIRRVIDPLLAAN